MQRSLTYQEGLNWLFLIGAYALYLSLSSIYLILPPLMAVLFYYYSYYLERKQTTQLFFIALMLVLLEAEKGFLLFSTIVYITLVHYLLRPFIAQFIHGESYTRIIHTVGAHAGYWLFSLLIHQMFWIDLPHLDGYTLYYIMIELMIIALL